MKQENSQLAFKAAQSITQLSAIVIIDLTYLSQARHKASSNKVIELKIKANASSLLKFFYIYFIFGLTRHSLWSFLAFSRFGSYVLENFQIV